MANEKKLFQNYINAATDLAESVKRNIVKDDGVIDDTTVNLLNKYITAMNALANTAFDEVESIDENDDNEKDPTLN